MTRIAAKNKAIAAFLAAMMCLPANIAFAQSASNEAAAQALFDEGRALMHEGKLAEACAKFAESNRLSPGAGTMLNLGACYEKSGQTASAWAIYADAASAADKANRKDWASRAKTRMAALAPDLSKLTISVPADAKLDGLAIKRDATDLGASGWGVSIPVDPGAHTIAASAPGHKPWSTTVQVGAKRDQVSVTVPVLEIDPATTAQASAPTSSPPKAAQASPGSDANAGNTQRYVGVGVGAVGVVGLGVGTVFGILANGKKSDAEPNCNADFSACNGAGVSDMKSARGSATISTIGFIAGGALLAAGVVLFVTAPKPHHQEYVGVSLAPNGMTVGGAW